jgi:hypothetical protein
MFRGWLTSCLALATTLGVAGALRSQSPDQELDGDEQFLADFHVDSSGPGLLAFFQSLTLNENDRRELESLATELGDESFAIREQASRSLKRRGAAALPVLHEALTSADPEVARRARFCIEEIERGPGPALTGAAVRVLRKRDVAGASETLFNYLPFNEDSAVENEILEALAKLTLRGGTANPILWKALGDAQPARRAAAAFVLGRLPDPRERGPIRHLLTDADAKIRLRAAQGLTVAQESAAIPTLIELVHDAPPSVSWEAEELLRRLAGEQAPVVSLVDGDLASRNRCYEAWNDWWRSHGMAIDWSSANDSRRLLGLTVIAEMDRNRVWECGPDGKVRWKLEGLQEPMDAHVLPNGRVLIAEYFGQRVTERDLKGNILWQKQLNDHPIACQRLANGNTFIVSYQALVEVTREGKEVFRHARGPGYFIFSAQKLRNGHIVFVNGHGALMELDGHGKDLRTIQISQQTGWCSVEGLANGHFLLAISGKNKLLEVDGAGKPVWECSAVSSPYAATRLPNGNTLVASMTRQRVVEIDRSGKVIWEKATDGRPFHAHRR